MSPTLLPGSTSRSDRDLQQLIEETTNSIHRLTLSIQDSESTRVALNHSLRFFDASSRQLSTLLMTRAHHLTPEGRLIQDKKTLKGLLAIRGKKWISATLYDHLKQLDFIPKKLLERASSRCISRKLSPIMDILEREIDLLKEAFRNSADVLNQTSPEKQEQTLFLTYHHDLISPREARDILSTHEANLNTLFRIHFRKKIRPKEHDQLMQLDIANRLPEVANYPRIRPRHHPSMR